LLDITDEQLARQARKGDQKALATLVERHQNTVFSMAYRILNDRDDALDASQEAYLRVCRHLGSYNPKRPFRPWIRRVAVRAALDQAAWRKPADGRDVDTLPSQGTDPLQAASGSQVAGRVQQALQALSPAQRAAFVCKQIEGMDTKETARAMGVRRATVRWHLFEAKKKLAALLGGEP
jgi:RNA polymerase sigma-70 factor (ECF subfamily)